MFCSINQFLFLVVVLSVVVVLVVVVVVVVFVDFVVSVVVVVVSQEVQDCNVTACFVESINSYFMPHLLSTNL